MVGHKLSEKTKRKISEKLKGRPLSKKTRQKMSLTRKGKSQPWNKGKKRSLETRRLMSKQRQGENHWNWQGGKEPVNRRIRKSIKYKLWREVIFRRDKWTCVLCGLNGGWNKQQKRHIDIHADHIKSFAKYPKLRFSIDNGRTLCADCHYKTETWGNNQYQLK